MVWTAWRVGGEHVEERLITRNIGLGWLSNGDGKHITQGVVTVTTVLFFFLSWSRMLRKGIRSWRANSVELWAFIGGVTFRSGNCEV